MKNIILLTLFLISSVSLFSKNDTIKIGEHNFVIKYFSTISGVCNDPDKEIKIYQGQKSVLRHIIHQGSCDSNSVAYEMGNCIAGDSCIILYSFWCRQGDTPISPFGARKQVYTIDDKGQLRMTDSQFYLERCYYDGYNEICNGMKYLHETPKTKEEKQIFRKHINQLQKEYKARFVFGEESDLLLKEVRGVMKDQIQEYTHYWSEIDSSFGYKK